MPSSAQYGCNQVNIGHARENKHNRDWKITVLDPKRVIKIITVHKYIV